MLVNKEPDPAPEVIHGPQLQITKTFQFLRSFGSVPDRIGGVGSSLFPL
jgi:hypothetical protein